MRRASLSQISVSPPKGFQQSGGPRDSIDFGVHAQVERPGVVQVGDPVEPL